MFAGTLGAARPFVVADPRRGNWAPTVRSPGNPGERRGGVCIVCGAAGCGADPFHILPVPLDVPPLAARADELARIFEGYGQDAVAALGARPDAFTADDQAWIAQNYASTLHEVEKAALRLVALRMAGSISGAAELLGMAPVSLRRWISRRSPVLGQAPVFWGKWRF